MVPQQLATMDRPVALGSMPGYALGMVWVQPEMPLQALLVVVPPSQGKARGQ